MALHPRWHHAPSRALMPYVAAAAVTVPAASPNSTMVAPTPHRPVVSRLAASTDQQIVKQAVITTGISQKGSKIAPRTASSSSVSTHPTTWNCS
jgi:hypothetical protein